MGLLKRMVQSMTGGVSRGFAFHRAILYLYGLAWWTDSLPYRIYIWVLMGFTIIFNYSLLYNPLHTSIDSPTALVIMMRNMVSAGVFLCGHTKLYLFYLLRGRLRKLILYMESMPHEGLALSRKRFIVIYGSVLGATGVGWIINGLFGKNNELMFDANFPWDESQGLGHTVALQFQLLSCNLCWLEHFGVDTIANVVCFKLHAHIRRLKDMLKQVGMDPEDDVRLLREAVQLHVAILKGVQLLNNLYKFILLFITIYLTIHSCIVIYSILKTDDMNYIILQLIPMMTSAYTQLFVYCTNGQTLTSEMDDLTRCCYDNDWYLSTPSVRRSLLMVMLCANKPVLYNAFGITAALYSNYLTNVQESFSYFLFLRTVETNMALSHKIGN